MLVGISVVANIVVEIIRISQKQITFSKNKRAAHR